MLYFDFVDNEIYYLPHRTCLLMKVITLPRLITNAFLFQTNTYVTDALSSGSLKKYF